jgi:hypothetical protein
MSNQPLNSNDLAKILIFTLLLLPIIGFGFGIIPTIFLGFGIFMMKKTQEFSHIETAVKNFKIYMQLALVTGVLFTLYCGNKYFTREGSYSRYDVEFFVSLSLSFVPIFYIVIINKLFYEPLREHREWLGINGFLANKNFFDPSSKQINVDIIKGEKLKSYSVADELIKWAKLKEDGHITQEEYDEARKKLLKKG